MKSGFGAFLAELKRRKVYHVAAAYVAVGAAIAVAAPDLFAAFELPAAASRFVILLVVVGFPLALVLAWAYEVKPEEPRVPEAALDAPPPPATAFPLHVAPAGDPRPSLAVLPFASFSEGTEADYFGLGVMEDVLTRLARVKGIRLISRTSVMRYKAAEKSAREIAQELGVQAVLEGSVRRSGGRVRVVAQLIDGRADEHLWADTYDRDLEDVFGVQTDIAESIAAALAAQLTEDERAEVRRVPTENVRAWELYLRAIQASQPHGPQDLAEAEQYLAEAVRLDPGFAQAWAGTAEVLVVTGLMVNERPSALFPRIELAARRALELDPGCAEAHTAVAVTKFFHDWDPKGAEEEFEKALRLDPDNAYALGWRGLTLTLVGRHEEGLALSRQAVALEPYLAQPCVGLAQVLVLSGNLEEAVASLQASTALWPRSPSLWQWLALARLYCGDPVGAVRDFDRAVAASGGGFHMRAMRAVAMVAAGRTGEARAELDEFKARAAQEYVDPYSLFCVTLALDGFDAASWYIEPMLENRSFILPYLYQVPRFRPLLADPRFRRIVETVLPGVMVEA